MAEVKQQTRPFGMRDKVAYAAGDFGCNMSFGLKTTMVLFWTQAMHMDSILMAGLLLLVQIWDAINDPLLGSMIDADRRAYKRGKFKTYILIGAIGLIIAGAMCFIPIEGADVLTKSIVFVAGYMLWDAFYTIANVPYGSMLSLISENGADRAQLSTWRSIGSMLGNILAMAALPFLIYEADGKTLIGERLIWIALVMGIIGFFAFQFMLKNTTLRVDENAVRCNEEIPKFNFFKAMGNFLKNRAAVGATLAAMAMLISMQGSSTATTTMFQFYFGDGTLSGITMVISFLPMFIFIPFVRKLVNAMGKKEACALGTIISFIGTLFLLNPNITPDQNGIISFMIGLCIFGFGMGFYTCISWSLMADAIDYSEWKFGAREEGTVYSLHSFFRKLAQGVGPSLVLILMGWLGYINAPVLDPVTGEHLKDAVSGELLYTVLDPNMPNAAENMRWLVAGIYIVGALVMLISICFIYNLNKKTVAQMTEELNERRGTIAKAEATATGASNEKPLACTADGSPITVKYITLEERRAQKAKEKAEKEEN